MANAKKRFEREMKRIMKYISKTGELPELNDYNIECLYHCIKEKNYIIGIGAMRPVSGNPKFDITGKLKLTKAGLDFCWKPIPWEMGANVVLAIITAISITIALIQSFG